MSRIVAMDAAEFQRFIDWYNQPVRPLRPGQFPSPADFDRMTPEQFDTYIETTGFAQRVRDALAGREPVIGNCPECDAPIGDGVPGCAHWPSA